ncbi:hypothetical protein FHS15_003305 [Paenibacillus castaneae]|uniref:hypothetical protein n=1 Tax=Paenibacillus castaneae TaxID=474957 RepID=UPI000C9C2517|nr:hypothetical protein [Paenibacillus castaneae]NIK78167.1 hypothetical protein [Paenibacillus castaneae]
MKEDNSGNQKWLKRLVIIGISVVVIVIVVVNVVKLSSKWNTVNQMTAELEKGSETVKEEPSETPAGSNAPSDLNSGIEETPEVTPQTEKVDEEIPVPSHEPSPKPSSNPTETGNETVKDTEAPTKKPPSKKEIDAKISGEMQKLRAACTASSNKLVQQIKQELSGDEEASLRTIQKKFIVKVAAEEANCDGKFNQLLSQAKSDYSAADISHDGLPDWSSEYEAAKEKTSSDALTEIASVLK